MEIKQLTTPKNNRLFGLVYISRASESLEEGTISFNKVDYILVKVIIRVSRSFVRLGSCILGSISRIKSLNIGNSIAQNKRLSLRIY